MNNYLPTQYQEYIHLCRYSRWLPDEGRRETWSETVGRYYDFFEEHMKEKYSCNINGGLLYTYDDTDELLGEDIGRR